MTFEEILAFWFGNEADDAMVAQEKTALWWSKDSETDAEIRARFQNLIEKAAEGELADWQTAPRGRLALILLTDQFPRSIYRETARAFAYDPRALKWCLDGLDNGLDQNLRPIERVFFYLPLEHSESRECQERSVVLFRQLLDEVRNQRQSEPVGARFIAPFEEFLDLRRPPPQYHLALRPFPPSQQNSRQRIDARRTGLPQRTRLFILAGC